MTDNKPSDAKTATPVAFIESARMAHERRSTTLRGEKRAAHVTACTFGDVVLSWTGAGLGLSSSMTPAEARALAAELLAAAAAAEAPKVAA